MSQYSRRGSQSQYTAGDGMRQMFLADQMVFAEPGAPPGVSSFNRPGRRGKGGAPQDAMGGQYPGPEPSQQQGSYVGWGGQAIPEAAGFRVPWFGRNRNKNNSHKPRSSIGKSGGKDHSIHGLPQASGPSYASGTRETEDSLSVEEVVQLFKRLPKSEAMPERVQRALYHFDSRGVALLLKDLSKSGQDGRAIELFDWLRQLPDRHLLRNLCDVYTYTAMISLCIYQQNIDRAMELMDEMRARNVERNVHTYTALMNVCIKSGKLTAALEMYAAMRAVDCTPNVVTYNTLIDVYGKLGQWDKAIQVLKVMRSEGVQPVLRTYNTLIIACNMCNQPREALSVYNDMMNEGFTANSTTYNALISAYGKLGKLEKVQEVYKDMVARGLERSVITYSSLISACEKAGQWETALQLFDESKRDGCTPNTVTYNSLITACAQGAQWERAQQVFEQMQQQGCTPDVVSYTALISAYERGGQWQRALQAFQQMCMQGCKPDAIVYNAIIDALWETGVSWAQVRALDLYKAAVKQGHFPRDQARRGGQGAGAGHRAEVNLHALTAGVAMLSLYCWVDDLSRDLAQYGEEALPPTLAIITDAGGMSKEQGNFVIKEAMAAMMSFWGAPFRPVADPKYSGVLEAPRSAVARWLQSDMLQAQLCSLFPRSGAGKAPEQLDDAREQQVSSTVGGAMEGVHQFEATHCLSLQNMGVEYVQKRSALVSQMLDFGSRLGLRDEVVHDAVLLMDRTVSGTAGVTPEVLPLVVAAALRIAIAQSGDPPEALPSDGELERVSGLPLEETLQMEWNVRHVLGEDTAAISTMRCLKIYLERLGYRYMDQQSIYGLAGLAIMLVVESLFDMQLLNCRPSVVAAAILYAERRQRGAVPFWPSSLAKVTGYTDMGKPELAMAVRTAQKLCRKVLYSQIYKAQAAALQAAPSAQQQVVQQPQPQPAGVNEATMMELLHAMEMLQEGAGAVGAHQPPGLGAVRPATPLQAGRLAAPTREGPAAAEQELAEPAPAWAV